MAIEVELDLVEGGRIRLEIAPPGAATSAYFAFQQHAGNEQIWPMIRRILSAAQQPIIQLSAELRKLGLKDSDVADGALRDLLRREGYGFGPIWELRRIPLEFDQMGRKTFVFVRDPREIIARCCAEDSTILAGDLMRSTAVGNLRRQYHACLEFCRTRQNVKIVRYEDVATGWYRLAADLANTLELEIKEEILFRSAKTATEATAGAPIFTYGQNLNPATVAGLELRFGEEMAYFGYAPEEAFPATFVAHRADFLRAVSARLSSSEPAAKPAAAPPDDSSTQVDRFGMQGSQSSLTVGISTRDPDFRLRLIPNASVERTVLGRSVIMDVDSEGCRPVLNQLASGEKILANYGCSLTYGVAVPAAETFCSILQSNWPNWRVENYGTPGYCQTQNVMQVERNSRWSAADYVNFCWIPSHLLRNVTEVTWLMQMMEVMPRGAREHPYTRSALDRDGKLVFRSTRFPRWDLVGVDLFDFRPDAYYLDLVAAALFKRAQAIVAESGGHFFITTLAGKFSATLERLIDDAGIPVIDASLDLSGPEYTCLPDDGHPNTRAHRYYAERINAYLRVAAGT